MIIVWQGTGAQLRQAEELGRDGDSAYLGSLSPSLTGVYGYDHRSRRVFRQEVTPVLGAGSAANPAPERTAVTFSGGTSVAEYGITPTLELGPVQVMYVRGGDMGGGVGGLLYSLRPASTGALPTVAGYKHFNARGDVLAQSNAAGQVTWAGGYESGGKRLVEKGTMSDRQKANTKEEDPSGLLNEGFRYRDMEIGMFISRDPAGFVDGPNLYAYCRQNPWSGFDPDGLTYNPFTKQFWTEGTEENLRQVKAWTGATLDAVNNTGYGAVDLIGKADSLSKAIVSATGPGWSWQKSPISSFAEENMDPFLKKGYYVEDKVSQFYKMAAPMVVPAAMASKTGSSAKLVAGEAAVEAEIVAGTPKPVAPAPRTTMYHYTDDAGLEGITSSQKLNPSLKANNPKDARYGNGQYLSDIVPGTMTNAQLSKAFLNMPYAGKKFKNYVEIDVTDLNVVKGRDGVYVVPNEAPLDLSGKIMSTGSN